jgi:hypothetical protein
MAGHLEVADATGKNFCLDGWWITGILFTVCTVALCLNALAQGVFARKSGN